MFRELYSSCMQFYSKKMRQRSLSIALFIILSVILSSSYNSLVIQVKQTAKLYDIATQSIDLTKREDNSVVEKRNFDVEAVGTDTYIDLPEEENILLVQTNCGLKSVILSNQRISINLPFESYQANLRVKLSADVTSVTMNNLPVRGVNYSLGLGNNLLDIGLGFKQLTAGNLTSNQRHHIVSLNRHNRELVHNSSHTEECYLEQDCDLIIYNRKCGLQPIANWTPSKDIEGYWRINCSSCSEQRTCQWDVAKWIETDQSARTKPSATSLRQCLQNYQLLFLGDSTNRGVMQSLMERTNSTLYQAPKSHGFVAYQNLGLSTNFSFTYYPAFWTKEQPTFAQTLHDLANNCSTAGKEEKTILVIGGVQWLTESQITELHSFVKRRNIPSKNVYIKTHSSGFHVNTSWTSIFHSNKTLRKLVRHNRALKKLAVSYGFGVIDTLQMTHSRYKEFLQGACACHFHQVNTKSVELSPSNTSLVKTSLQQLGLVEKLPPLTQYHISGPIHNAYTDMLIRRICSSIRT